MGELQDALDRWDSDRSEDVINRTRSESDDVALFVDAARRVANPDLKAANRAANDDDDGMWGLSDISEWRVQRIVFAALGVTTEDDDGDCSCPTDGLHARWCPDAEDDD